MKVWQVARDWSIEGMELADLPEPAPGPGQVAVRMAEDGVQIFGGYGFVKDYPAEKYFRDVKLTTIGEGTSEIQRLVIARQLLAA